MKKNSIFSLAAHARLVPAAAAIGAALCGAALAQAPGPPQSVSWSVAPQTADVAPGSRIAITLRGAVVGGWHVYGLKQLPNGPIPLEVAVDANAVAKARGAPTASPPRKFHDPAFKLETQYYDQPFTLTVPVSLGSKLAAGPQIIPVSVRFQSCNGDICLPPRTVRLSATVNVRNGG